MKVILSVAVSLDGCIDDRTPERLVLSSPEDWAEVHSLRAKCDAILVGAGTLRNDDPSLRIKEPALREERLARGQEADIVRVTVSGSGQLDPSLRFFGPGGRRIIFTSDSTAVYPDSETIVSPQIDAAHIITELERRGIRTLLAEGGSRIISMLLREGAVDRMRLAVAPFIVGDSLAPRLVCDGLYPCSKGRRALIEEVHTAGNISVTTLSFRDISPETEARDRQYLRRAIELSRNCQPRSTCYRVGALVVTAAGQSYEGYTGETAPANHAEEEAIAKALAAGADLRGAAIYSSIEPCSHRSSKPESCSRLIIRHGFAKAVFALYEPDKFASCQGALNMRRAGVEVRAFTDLGSEVMEINSHLFAGRQ